MKGVIIDIDGVLIQGKTAVAGARESLSKLREAGIPHVFVTNGGGLPQRTKAEQIAHILKVDPEEVLVGRLVQAHDPIVGLLKRDGVFEKRVLVLSKSEEHSRGVCKEWGLPNGVVIEDFERDCPWIWPVADDGRPIDAESQQQVAAICVVATPHDWGHSLQLACDLLLNGGRLFPNHSNEQRPHLYVSNPDFDYRARPLLNRMTTGAWLECLRALMAHYQTILEPILLGKPHAPIYDMAKDVLAKQVVGNIVPAKLFAIGDNPISDIRGARVCGAHAILVLTGVAQQNDPENPADTVCASIVEAVDMVILSSSNSK